jgi:integrase
MDILKLPQKEIRDKLEDYVIFMRDKKLSYSSIKGRMAPIISFLEFSDILVNKKKIKSFYGEENKTVKDRPYTTEEITKMLSQAKLRVKVMILIYSSTGMRRDAILDLQLKHLEKIPEYGIYKVTAYNVTKDEYTTFTTAECANMIDQYLKHREQSGEVINKESYLIRNDYDYCQKDMSKNPKPVTSINVSTLFRQLVIKTGLRAENQPKHDRHEVALFNGYRKFFTNQLIESGITTEYRWLLEGHNLKANDPHYVRISEKQLLREYLKAINNLTISNEERLKVKVENLQIESSQYESLRNAFEKLNNEVSRLKQQQK